MERAARGVSRESDVLARICEAAHATGDPGAVFLDTVNNSLSNPIPAYGPVYATNPCGEQALYPYDSCNLGSINLSAFVSGASFDWVGLGRVVRDAVRFLDSVITVNPYPIDECAQIASDIRRIGLGVMGWADSLFKLGVRYGSPASFSLAESVMSFIAEEARRASEDLAAERGPFPLQPKSRLADSRPRRNSALTTIAPTGTISIIAGCSAGIEPVFALRMKRAHRLDREDLSRTTEMFELNPVYADWCEVNPRGAKPDYFVDAHTVTPDEHLAMQSAFQRYTENGVSKTINLPASATVEDVRDIYESAWIQNLKGITVFRDGCKDNQVLSHACCDDPDIVHEEGCSRCRRCDWSACDA